MDGLPVILVGREIDFAQKGKKKMRLGQGIDLESGLNDEFMEHAVVFSEASMGQTIFLRRQMCSLAM